MFCQWVQNDTFAPQKNWVLPHPHAHINEPLNTLQEGMKKPRSNLMSRIVNSVEYNQRRCQKF